MTLLSPPKKMTLWLFIHRNNLTLFKPSLYCFNPPHPPPFGSPPLPPSLCGGGGRREGGDEGRVDDRGARLTCAWRYPS